MKQLITLLILVFSGIAFAQNSNLIVFNNTGQQFFVVLNGIKQNSIPKTNVKVEGLTPTAYRVKIIFADGRTGDIDKNIFLEPGMEYSAEVLIKSSKKRTLRLFNMVALNTSPYGNGAQSVTYRPNDAAIYSDQISYQNTPTQGTISGNLNGQTTVNTNSQTGMVQTNVNGMPQGNISVSGNVTGTDTQSQNYGNSQSGSIQTNVNGMPQGNVTTTTNGTQQTNTNQSGNIQMNIGLNGIGVTDNMGGISMNFQMNGMGSPTQTNSQTVTTTTQTTVNGQTTQYTSTVNTNDPNYASQMNGQNGMNVQTTVNGMPQGNVYGNTAMGGQTQTYSQTNVNGVPQGNSSVNGNVNMNGMPQGNVYGNATINTQSQNTGYGSQTQGNYQNSNQMNVQSSNDVMNGVCLYPMANIDYIITGIDEANFSDDQMKYVKEQLRTECINSDQAYRIVNAFTFDGDKITMAKFCYDHMTDKQNAKKLLDLFSFSSSKEELKKYFNIK